MYPSREDFNTWDVYCLICAGPPLNPALITIFNGPLMLNDFPHLKEHAHEFDWLDKYLGVPENNAPLELGLYDTQGDFELPNKRLFCPYPSYMQAPREDHKQYGLTCHAKCYQLLQERLGYTLLYQDVWPLLDAANDDNTCLDSLSMGAWQNIKRRYAHNSADVIRRDMQCSHCCDNAYCGANSGCFVPQS